MVNRLPLIKVVPDKQLEAQSAAFMIKENNEVDHHPPKTWKYYSEAGANGAAHSCLGLSDFSYFPQTSFITGFIQEPGEINSFVGHRRWILFSKVKKFSYGATDKSEALYCIEEFSKDTVKTDFIAYPWNGYVPANLIFRKWSFAIPEGHDVNFKHVKITIKNNVGNSIPFEMYPENPDYPDKTITWKMTSMFTEQEEEQEINNLKAKGYIGKEISVKIENVEVDHRTKNYEYKVKIVDLK